MCAKLVAKGRPRPGTTPGNKTIPDSDSCSTVENSAKCQLKVLRLVGKAKVDLFRGGLEKDFTVKKGVEKEGEKNLD